jgi:hypothetical protein
MLGDILAVRSRRRFRRQVCAIGAALLCGTGTTLASAQTDVAASIDIPFSSFFRHPVGPRGLEISDELRATDGRSVRLVGYMVLQEDAQPGRFLLTPRPVRMSEHADGDADDLPPATVTVLLDSGQRDRIILHRTGLVSLTGRLEYGRLEDATGKVSWVRLHLSPQATAAARPESSARGLSTGPDTH